VSRPPSFRNLSSRTRLDPDRDEIARDRRLSAECGRGVLGTEEVDAEGDVEREGPEVKLAVFFNDDRNGGGAPDLDDDAECGRCC